MESEPKYDRAKKRLETRHGVSPKPFPPEVYKKELSVVESGIRSALKETPSALAAIIFGSFAIGDPDEQSDIDIFLLYSSANNSPTPEDFQELVRRNGVKFPVSVNFLMNLGDDKLNTIKTRYSYWIRFGYRVVGVDENIENLINQALS